MKEWNVERGFQRRRHAMHCIRAEQYEIRPRGLHLQRRPRDLSPSSSQRCACCSLLIPSKLTVTITLPRYGGRPADPSAILGRRFPAHAPDQSDHLHFTFLADAALSSRSQYSSTRGALHPVRCLPRPNFLSKSVGYLTTPFRSVLA
jgi:hypothetical protein